jgi:hypothetical protein
LTKAASRTYWLALASMFQALPAEHRDEEWKALTTQGLTLDAAKQAATDLMHRYPAHRALARSILDFAEDSESDIAGALSGVEARMPRRRERGGAT